MVGGVKFEHGHRMIAEAVGLLTVLLAAALQWGRNRNVRLHLFVAFVVLGVTAFLTESPIQDNPLRAALTGASLFFLALSLGTFLPFREARPWMRTLGWLALAGVIAQGILGGLTVRMFLPWYISTAHAALAQTFFALLVVMALFTSQNWIANHSLALPETRRPGLFTLSALSLAALYLQLFFGAAFRHGGMSFAPHFLNSILVFALLIWTSVRAMTETRLPAVRTNGRIVHALLMLQVLLGIAAYFTRVRWGADAPQPLPSMVASTVAHVGVGALLLAFTFVLAIQSKRNLLPAGARVASAHSRHDEVTA